MPDPVNDLKQSLGQFVQSSPLVAPAVWMGQMGNKIMQSPLAIELMKRLGISQQSPPPVTYIKGGKVTR